MRIFIKKIILLGLLSLSLSFSVLVKNSFAEEGEAKKVEKIDLTKNYADMIQAVESYIEEVGAEKDIDPEKDMVVMFTELGYVAIHLDSKEAKKSLRAVRVLIKSGFYDNLEFFRVVQNYFVQFGDPSSSGGGGSGVFVEDEFTTKKSHVRGTVAMANFGTPNSQDSQLFIVLNRSPWLNGKYTIIGTVIHGIEVIEQISFSPVLENGTVVKPLTITKMVMYDTVNTVDPSYYDTLKEIPNNVDRNKVVESNLEFEAEIKALKGQSTAQDSLNSETEEEAPAGEETTQDGENLVQDGQATEEATTQPQEEEQPVNTRARRRQ